MLWNANGLHKHQRELEVVLNNEKIDVCLISETHFTTQSYIRFKNYEVYHTTHPTNTARGGSAVIVRKSIKHIEDEEIKTDEFQATTIKIFTKNENLLITALYSPPKHQIKYEQYKQLIEKHNDRHIIGGDFNAKHTHWGSRLTTTKGRELLKASNDTGCSIISSGTPTYWPTDTNKIPDLIDFFLVKKISTSRIKIENGFDLSSDHSPIFLTLFEKILTKEPPPFLINKFTDWQYFNLILWNADLKVEAPISVDDLENEVEILTATIQKAAWQSTPDYRSTASEQTYPVYIREKIQLKRKIRKKWQQTRHPSYKTLLNKITKELSAETKLFRDMELRQHLLSLTTDKSTDYSLWKATKGVKRPVPRNYPIRKDDSSWAKTNMEKAQIFSEHMENVFSNNNEVPTNGNEGIGNFEQSIENVTVGEVYAEIGRMQLKKCPGFDLINTEILRNLTYNCIIKITQLFNSCFKLRRMPTFWKIAEIRMIPKPGKPTTEVTSYRPISLLPMLSKLLEKLFLSRLNPIIAEKNLIPDHQFGFRNSHSTIDQIHRITNTIEQSFEDKKICSAVFLDVSQAFDKVCHVGLIRKLSRMLPEIYVEFLKSFLSDRFFRIKQDDSYSDMKKIGTGVPQGSILGPVLYLLYTSDLPEPPNSVIATFADDTAILAVADTEEQAITKLQQALNEINRWASVWQIKLNHSKSVHVNFTNKATRNIPVHINGVSIPYSDNAKYLGMTLDSKLRWKAHVKKKIEELNIKWSKLKYLMGRKSELSIQNKLLLYNQQLKPIWLYGIQLWGCTHKKYIYMIQNFQNKVLRSIVNAPWYVRNSDLHRDLRMNTVSEEISIAATKHDARLRLHVNPEAINLNDPSTRRRLNRTKPYDLLIS